MGKPENHGFRRKRVGWCNEQKKSSNRITKDIIKNYITPFSFLYLSIWTSRLSQISRGRIFGDVIPLSLPKAPPCRPFSSSRLVGVRLYSRPRLARQVTTNRHFLIGCSMGKPENHGFRRKGASVWVELKGSSNKIPFDFSMKKPRPPVLWQSTKTTVFGGKERACELR